MFGHVKMDRNLENNHFALMEILLVLELNHSNCDLTLRSLLE